MERLKIGDKMSIGSGQFFQETTKDLGEYGGKVGLLVSCEKTKSMSIGDHHIRTHLRSSEQ